MPSKGKRVKKRKVQEARSNDEITNTERTNVTDPPMHLPEPSLLKSYLTIGFNCTTRHLESLSQTCKPKSLCHSNDKLGPYSHPGESDEENPTCTRPLDSAKTQKQTSLQRHIAAVFVPRSSQPSVLHAHLPLLIYTASMAHPTLPPTRLVTLPKGSEVSLCDALALPRISFLGIMEDAPHSAVLIEYVRQHVPAIEVPWLQRTARGEYMPAHINAIQTTTPVVPKAKRDKLKSEDVSKRKRGQGEDGIGSYRKKAKRGKGG